MRRVVVTGLGLLTPLGNDVGSTWEGLVAGRSGLDWIQSFDTSAYESPIGGELKGFEPEQHVDAKLLRRIDRSSVLALTAVQEAVADADLAIAGHEREIGVLLGTGMGSAHLIIEQQQILDAKGPRRVSPFLTSHMLPDTATGLVAMALGARGPNYAVTAACATGGAATGEAAAMIARGDADVMITGGDEAPLRPIYCAGFHAMKALSTRKTSREGSRPFDAPATGSCRRRRGAPRAGVAGARAEAPRPHLAEIEGYATTTTPTTCVAAAEDGHGVAEAMEQALKRRRAPARATSTTSTRTAPDAANDASRRAPSATCSASTRTA